jgi:hypothetical protein
MTRKRCMDERELLTEELETISMLVSAMDLIQRASELDHLDGCLFRNDKRMPCQCGFNDRMWAIDREGRALVAEWTREQ